MPEESLNPTGPRKDLESDDLQASLGGLKPAIGQIVRDQFFFRAGQVSAASAAPAEFTVAPRKHGWRWPLATAAAAMLSAVVTLAVDRSSRPGEQMVVRESTAAPVETGSIDKVAPTQLAIDSSASASTSAARQDMQHTSSPNNYLALHRRIVAGGIDALSEPSFGEAPEEGPANLERGDTYRELRTRYLSNL